MKYRHLTAVPRALDLALLALASATLVAPPGEGQAAPARSGRAIPAGRVEHLTMHSSIDRSDRGVWVYTPPGYDARRPGGYDLLVAFDGDDYQSPTQMGLPAILDSLLEAGASPPFVALLVNSATPAARIAELGNSRRYARFLGEELVPWARAKWNVTRDPHRTVVTGSSAGGLGAAFAAFERPDIFGNVLSQSGAFWRGAEGSNEPPYEWLAAQYAAAPARDVTFLLDVGSMETIHVLGGAGPVFIEANRRLRDVLVRKGYRVTYTEVPGGVHAMQTWRPRFPVDLVALVRQWPGEGRARQR